MAKFMILFSSSKQAQELMAQASPEEMKAGMDAWMKWRDEAVKTTKFEWGLPLQPVAEITSDGSIGDSDSMVSGYAIMEADSKDVITDLLKSHPHRGRDGSSIDVLQMIPMPGM